MLALFGTFCFLAFCSSGASFLFACLGSTFPLGTGKGIGTTAGGARAILIGSEGLAGTRPSATFVSEGTTFGLSGMDFLSLGAGIDLRSPGGGTVSAGAAILRSVGGGIDRLSGGAAIFLKMSYCITWLDSSSLQEVQYL